MESFLFYLGKSFQALGLGLTGLAVFRGIFHQASMSEEIQLTGFGLLAFGIGWAMLRPAGKE